jgi:hypothetical protein
MPHHGKPGTAEQFQHIQLNAICLQRGIRDSFKGDRQIPGLFPQRFWQF